jgi:hypothetical protein
MGFQGISGYHGISWHIRIKRNVRGYQGISGDVMGYEGISGDIRDIRGHQKMTGYWDIIDIRGCQ